MKIELKCKTGGFNFGDIVEVGKGKGKIEKEVAETLVKDGLAVIVNEKVTADAKDLLSQNKKLQDEVAKLSDENKKLQDEISALKGEKK